jgi:hypothetical protein
VTIIYAYKLETNHPYFENVDEIMGGAPDPVSAFKKANSIAAQRPDWKLTLVQRETGGEWMPVPADDLVWIAEWARHAIEKKLSRAFGYGWSSCACGWATGKPGTDNGTADFDRAASEHIAVERQRAKDAAGRTEAL